VKWIKLGTLVALTFEIICPGNGLMATELPPYRTVAVANIGFSLSNVSNIGLPSDINRSVITPNPFAGSIGEPSGFPNFATATAGISGGPLNKFSPFASSAALSTAPSSNTGATMQYSFKIISDVLALVPVNIRSLVSQSIGYQAMGINADPTIFYGYFGQNSSSTVSVQIQPFGFGDIITLSKICGKISSDCSDVEGNYTIWNNQFYFQTNSLYYITLSAGAFGFAPPFVGHIATATFATAYIDSFLDIDESVIDRERYLLQFSANVRNIPPITGIPEPELWLMMVIGFGFIGNSLRQRARNFDNRSSI
jgi:hypothetical protein